jgi:hypothetical protein
MYRYEEAIGIAQNQDFFGSYEKLLQLLLESNINFEYRTTVAK